MKFARIAAAALGLAAFAAAPAFAGGCSSYGQTTAEAPPPSSTVGS